MRLHFCSSVLINQKWCYAKWWLMQQRHVQCVIFAFGSAWKLHERSYRMTFIKPKYCSYSIIFHSYYFSSLKSVNSLVNSLSCCIPNYFLASIALNFAIIYPFHSSINNWQSFRVTIMMKIATNEAKRTFDCVNHLFREPGCLNASFGWTFKRCFAPSRYTDKNSRFAISISSLKQKFLWVNVWWQSVWLQFPKSGKPFRPK